MLIDHLQYFVKCDVLKSSSVRTTHPANHPTYRSVRHEAINPSRVLDAYFFDTICNSIYMSSFSTESLCFHIWVRNVVPNSIIVFSTQTTLQCIYDVLYIVIQRYYTLCSADVCKIITIHEIVFLYSLNAMPSNYGIEILCNGLVTERHQHSPKVLVNKSDFRR